MRIITLKFEECFTSSFTPLSMLRHCIENNIIIIMTVWQQFTALFSKISGRTILGVWIFYVDPLYSFT